MVAEFPELQGVMGRYYALHDGEDARVAEAIAAHYRPAGAGDEVPRASRSPSPWRWPTGSTSSSASSPSTNGSSGSGDPYGLRRAALGVIRILRENGLRLALRHLLAEAFFLYPAARAPVAAAEFGMAVATEVVNSGWRPTAGAAHPPMVEAFAQGVLLFLLERLRIQLRAEGARHDILAAAIGEGQDDDLLRVLARAEALAALITGPEGADLLAAYTRAANILRAEEKRDGPHEGPVEPRLLEAAEEKALFAALEQAEPAVSAALAAERFADAMAALAALRPPLDAFFERVTVNAPDADLRRNRLRLLHRVRRAMQAVADFGRIEG